ncbi:EAL and HDOD domain-containing protein [Christensenella intestinihominis]|uniref:EAL and HDOD domain-containing protein n=1 Tax=Christensenella intestinihominis TaxID=1851429 RepID=UPI0008337B50|nr:HDOD domain-containing protein [Christensenella intestinihominis]
MQTQPYIVKQPIHNSDNQLYAYEILYVEDESVGDPSGDAAAANAIETLLMQFQSEGFLEDKVAFVNFTPGLLLRNVPQTFDSDKLVIQIDEDVLLNPLAMKLAKKYRKQGYKIALKGFEFNSRYLSAIDSVDMIKINFKLETASKDSIAEIAKGLGKDIVAFNIDNEETYHAAVALGVKYMQGTYIGTMLPEKIHRIEHLQSNFFQLVIAVTKDDADFDEIEELISRDVTLTYALLKLVNSSYFALRNNVESVHQALVVLGLGQLRQWIYLLSFQSDSDIPSEFIKMSFMRANFCAELQPLAKDMPISKSEAYLMGMFSTLGSLLDVTLEEALGELSISEYVVQALLTQEGRAGLLYGLVLFYEQGNWVGMSNNAEALGISVQVISQKYFECVDTVNETWDSLIDMNSQI